VTGRKNLFVRHIMSKNQYGAAETAPLLFADLIIIIMT